MHQLTKVYSIHHQLSPKYLCDVIQSYQIQHIYQTRRATNPNFLDSPVPRKELYKKSFFLSAIKEWNTLSPAYTNSPSLSSFKRKLVERNKIVPPFFNNNIPRHSQVVIGQLRIGFSDLNSHLFDKGCINSPQCPCGFINENTKHFLMTCPNHNVIRDTLLTNLANMNLNLPINPKLLLYGGNQLPRNTNFTIQEHLSKFIIDSKRFLNYQNK